MAKAGTSKATATEPFEIKNRFTGEIIFTAELTCSPDTLPSIKLGLAVKAAVKADAYLADADLAGANLARANLARATLARADLADAYLADAKGLTDEALRQLKADFFLTLLHAKAEVPALISALREGRVDGSQYEGECACLVGTLANARGDQYRSAFPDASADHPAERWFMMISKGDKPGDDSRGGFASSKALDWAMEFCALEGIETAEQVPA